jgi:hypothetical protein
LPRSIIAAGCLAALAGRARAEVCPPAVALAGDAALVGAVGDVLATRGIALDAPGCPAVAARIDARDGALVIGVAGVERVVGDTATAATVIESFSRADVATPLLAIRAVPRGAPPDEDRGVAPARDRSARGVQLFGAFEGSYASDRTTWMGAHVGACVMLGPVCAAARLRMAGVAGGPGVWDGAIERRSMELLFGIDIPLAVGGLTVTPGFAAGLGQMHTRDEQRDVRNETGGPRADVHVTVSIPIGGRLAVDLFAAVDLTQETHVEHETEPLPDEPRALVRLGAGARFGGL